MKSMNFKRLSLTRIPHTTTTFSGKVMPSIKVFNKVIKNVDVMYIYFNIDDANLVHVRIIDVLFTLYE